MVDSLILEEKNQTNISQYLQAPQRKRKNYVIMAMGSEFNKELHREIKSDIERYLKKSYKDIAVTKPANDKELTRLFNRKIRLLIIDDGFDSLPNVMTLVQTLKLRRNKEKIPVLFLTKDKEKLVQMYHDHLIAWHETDEYIDYTDSNREEIFSCIKKSIETKNQRRARRYKLNHKANFYLLDSKIPWNGEILDLSIYGALIRKEKKEGEAEKVFREGDQMKVSIPIEGYQSITEYGDFLKLSAKVRRVFISGKTAAISFEHLSETQIINLTKFLTSVVSKELHRKAIQLRDEINSSDSE